MKSCDAITPRWGKGHGPLAMTVCVYIYCLLHAAQCCRGTLKVRKEEKYEAAQLGELIEN